MERTELRKLADNILSEMYAKAEPPLEYRAIRENPEQAPENWYEQHFLPQEKQTEIFDKHVEHVDLTDREHTTLVMECILNAGPASTPVEE